MSDARVKESHCNCCRRPVEDCKVMREIRLLKTTEGRAQLREEYYEQLRARAKQLDAREDGSEWSHAQKAGCPMDALIALKHGPMDTRPLEYAKRFCNEAKGLATFLNLLGDKGIGKTVAATYVVVDFCKRWPWNDRPSGGPQFEPVVYAEAGTFTRLSAFDATSREYVERLRETRLLVLEDAGNEGTDFGKGVLGDLLMHRHAAKRRTVLCSNLTGEPFVKRYGDAVADRLRSSGLTPNLQGLKSLRKKLRLGGPG